MECGKWKWKICTQSLIIEWWSTRHRGHKSERLESPPIDLIVALFSIFCRRIRALNMHVYCVWMFCVLSYPKTRVIFSQKTFFLPFLTMIVVVVVVVDKKKDTKVAEKSLGRTCELAKNIFLWLSLTIFGFFTWFFHFLLHSHLKYRTIYLNKKKMKMKITQTEIFPFFTSIFSGGEGWRLIFIIVLVQWFWMRIFFHHHWEKILDKNRKNIQE